jgi:hypothetical protein
MPEGVPQQYHNLSTRASKPKNIQAALANSRFANHRGVECGVPLRFP